ncbi:MAG TPA: MBL fold metallo-hydrolase [Dehalococcoidia bacterium]|nr:MBL fold metallo-hydrolase [Dehalococcoidia bacterium]
MSTEVHEIAPDIFRIATYREGGGVTFVQFLIRDDEPLLYHTGGRAIFDETREALNSLIDLAKLRYIGWSHLEADECGALNDFLGVAPNAEPVQGPLGSRAGDFFTKPIRAIADGETLDLGQRRLRFITTPHVPHSWDAITAYEETTGTLFVSDLFTAFGRTTAVTDKDIVEPALAVLDQMPDYLPVGPHTSRVFERLEALQPNVLAGHHSPTYFGDATQALRDLRGEMFRKAGLPV